MEERAQRKGWAGMEERVLRKGWAGMEERALRKGCWVGMEEQDLCKGWVEETVLYVEEGQRQEAQKAMDGDQTSEAHWLEVAHWQWEEVEHTLGYSGEEGHWEWEEEEHRLGYSVEEGHWE